MPLRQTLSLFVLLVMISAPSGSAVWAQSNATPPEEALRRAQAYELAQTRIIVDGHIDVPYRVQDSGENVAEVTALGDFDYYRARAGGLNAPFMSIYIPVEYQEAGGAKALADSLIDMVQGLAEEAPEKFALATSPEEVRRHFEEGLISLPMGIENGAALEGELSNLEHFYDRGIRYMTLAHAEPNELSDSSYDSTRVHGGLSAFGVEVVQAMNRLGMMVDVSHITDEAFYDVMEVTEAPVIASHSSARHFTPGWERNMSDAMIQALAENGGVIMVVFGSSFLRSAYQEADDPIAEEAQQYLEAAGLAPDSPAGQAYYEWQRKAHPIGTAGDVADHIDHIVELVGVEHVGLGSDFDGVFALPRGLQDASQYPNLIYELLERGYPEEEITMILGQNLLRVWEAVEQVAQEMQQASR